MPDRRDPPPTEEGWFALHEFHEIDWDTWRTASDRERERALEAGVEYFTDAVAVADADEGASAVYSVLGHEADLLVVHLRPSSGDLDALSRQYALTPFAGYTERARSFVSVTEASGYSQRARQYFTDDLDDDSGLARYIDARLKPTIPDRTHVCFYPMDKRRQPDQNWYDLPFDERAEHMAAHGEIGREYGGRVTQMVTTAVGIDDWEWGVTLWSDELTDVKDLLYEMRFDPSTSRYAEFGSFFVGRTLQPTALPALLAGDRVPSGDTTAPTDRAADQDSTSEAESTHGGGLSEAPVEDVPARLVQLGLSPDERRDAYAVVCYSTAEATELADAVAELRTDFDRYDSHEETVVRAQGGRSVVASLWATRRAADTAAGFLTDLPEIAETVHGPVDSGTEAETAPPGETAPAGRTEPAVREELAEAGVYAGQPRSGDLHAVAVYSDAPIEKLTDAAASLTDAVGDREDHAGTAVYGRRDGSTAAIVSRWHEPPPAVVGKRLADVPGVLGSPGDGDGFETLGLFYQVEPAHREAFVEKFDDVRSLLADESGHRDSALLVNTEDETDMFIASRWDSRADALAFFRSEAFADAVDWGRGVLAADPQHVFFGNS